jgi:hypothetical protein
MLNSSGFQSSRWTTGSLVLFPMANWGSVSSHWLLSLLGFSGAQVRAPVHFKDKPYRIPSRLPGQEKLGHGEIYPFWDPEATPLGFIRNSMNTQNGRQMSTGRNFTHLSTKGSKWDKTGRIQLLTILSVARQGQGWGQITHKVGVVGST